MSDLKAKKHYPWCGVWNDKPCHCAAPEPTAPVASWRPISEAPTDGSIVMVGYPGKNGYAKKGLCFHGKWQEYATAKALTPTHYQPLPPPPTAECLGKMRNGGKGSGCADGKFVTYTDYAVLVNGRDALVEALNKISKGANTSCMNCKWLGHDDELCETAGIEQCPACGSTDLIDAEYTDVAREALKKAGAM